MDRQNHKKTGTEEVQGDIDFNGKVRVEGPPQDSAPQMTSPSSNEDSTPVLGWAGWWLPLPEDWKILKVSGNDRAGSLTMGDNSRPRLEITWAWVSKVRFNPEKYLRKFLVGGMSRADRHSAKQSIMPLLLPHFSKSFCIKDKDRVRGVAYCEQTHRILHWVYHGTSADVLKFEERISSWRDQSLQPESRWQFFGISFFVPSGFRLSSFLLNLGDMKILLSDSTGWWRRERLLVRHISPAVLALARRPFREWLIELFRDNRRIYRLKDPEKKMDGGQSLILQGRLRFVLRVVLRPLVILMPSRIEVSLHHLIDNNQLLYLEISAPVRRIDAIRNTILANRTTEAVS